MAYELASIASCKTHFESLYPYIFLQKSIELKIQWSNDASMSTARAVKPKLQGKSPIHTLKLSQKSDFLTFNYKTRQYRPSTIETGQI